MYFQTVDGNYVLNPHYAFLDIGNYETHDDGLRVLVTNKKDINKLLKNCFVDATAEFVKKIGAFNCFEVTLLGPIIVSDITCPTHDNPPLSETTLFSYSTTKDILTSKRHRPSLLTDWVLQGQHPTQFNKLLKENFDVIDFPNSDIIKIVKKSIESNPKADI